jgi:hypothetical protein
VAIYGNASISNLTLSGNASVGGVNRWDIGDGSTGVSFQGNSNTLTKVGGNQITFRPEFVTNLAGIVVREGVLNHEAFNRTDASTLTTTNTVHTNDAVVGATTLAYGGVLNVSNLGGTLGAGDTFKLFGAWAYIGSFAAMSLPNLTSGLAWDTSGLLVDGSKKVVSSAAAPALSGAALLPNGNFQLTLAGTIGQGYKILASTNAALPLASWTVLQSGTLPTATYNWEDTSTKSNPTRFYIVSTP